MRKYLFIYKSEVMSNIQYVFNILIGFIGYLIMLFILFNLYRYLYDDPTKVINGYTMNQTVWYVIVTEILWSITGSRKLCRKISEDVKGGNIAYNINKPYNYIGYALFSHLGEATIKAIPYVLFAMIMGYIFLGSFPKISIISILTVLITSIIAVIIASLLSICVGLVSFKIEDSGPLHWVYSKLILLFGTIFPIEYFPASIQKVLTYTPVYVTTYGPAKLFVDFNYPTLLNVIISQLVYLLLVLGLANIMYRKGVKNLNVNGG